MSSSRFSRGYLLAVCMAIAHSIVALPSRIMNIVERSFLYVVATVANSAPRLPSARFAGVAFAIDHYDHPSIAGLRHEANTARIAAARHQ